MSFVSRQEKLQLRLTLDKSAEVKHKADVDLLVPNRATVNEGDTLYVDYTFFVSYFDDTARKLEAVNRLVRSPGIVVSGSLEELIHGRCLIREVLSQLDRLIDREARR